MDINELSKLAESGDINAQIDLGVCYVKGDGVPLDAKKAAYWWQKAADGGNDVAQYYLGLLYLDGVGVEKNLETTKRLWQQAIEGGNKNAINNSKHLFGK